MTQNAAVNEQQNPPDDEGIRATTLAHVNFSLFRQLISLGTTREKICATLCLNHNEYDYLAHLR